MPRRKLTETVCAAISSANTGKLPASYSTQTTICDRCKLQTFYLHVCLTNVRQAFWGDHGRFTQVWLN